MTPKIICHGGAWDWDDALDAAKARGVAAAARIGHDILLAGGTALDAVEKTVNALEDNPVFDAATGGYLNRAGVVQTDALIVDGATYNFGAVGGASRVQYPISLARLVMERTDFNFFVGDGADRLAAELSMPLIDNAQLITPEMQAFFDAQRTDGNASDTVGAIAIDANGNVAAATSTSGIPYKPVGRVGDSPLYGSGGYAQNGVGTVGATGMGEHIMRTLLSKYVADRMADGLTAQDASFAAMTYIDRLFDNSMAGVITIDALGNISAAHTTPKLAIGWVDDNGNINSAMNARAIQN
ncbi:MAG: isoaspartyl peptidase/L-asparaginase family protein [Candidatus Promineifilaceae bacterium]